MDKTDARIADWLSESVEKANMIRNLFNKNNAGDSPGTLQNMSQCTKVNTEQKETSNDTYGIPLPISKKQHVKGELKIDVKFFLTTSSISQSNKLERSTIVIVEHTLGTG